MSLNAAPVAQLQQVVKRYGGVLALNKVDFQIAAGEIRALIGKNGAGKSTLIRLLTGAELPDSGTVEINGQRQKAGAGRVLGVQAVYQELSLIPDMSVMENLFLGAWPRRGLALNHRLMRSRCQQALANLAIEGVAPDQLVVSLSSAQQQLVEIARAVMGVPQLVILDEPTSSLAQREAELVLAAVRNLSARGIAVIYVSHRMKEIRAVAHSATVLRNGQISGPHSLQHLDDQRVVELMLGHSPKDASSAEKKASKRPTSGPAKPVLQAENLTVAPKLQQVNLTLYAGEILGLAGLLGSGRSELLRALAGIDPLQSGQLSIAGQRLLRWNYPLLRRAALGFTPENRKHEGIFPVLGVDENIVLSDAKRVSSSGFIRRQKVWDAAKRVMRSMHIKADNPQISIQTLSGGNQQKAVIGRWLHAEAKILLLDEPTRGVDVEAKFQIYQIMRALAENGTSIIFVSSELDELPLVCDRVLVLGSNSSNSSSSSSNSITHEFQAPDIRVEALVAACMFDGVHPQPKIPL